MKVGRPIYTSNGNKLLSAGMILTDSFISRLRMLGIPAIYIDDGFLTDVPIEDVISDETRVKAINMVREITECSRRQAAAGRPVVLDSQAVMLQVEEIIEELLSRAQLLVNLSDIRAVDDYTFGHSVNVCVLALKTGINLNLSRVQLKHLGVGALLHDIGKIRIPLEILNKPGKLSEEEFETVKRHPLYGFEIVSHQRGISKISADVAYQHHERLNGTGYPRGLSQDDIHLFARITGVVDVYDALTADRVYRKAYLPHQVYELLAGSGGSQFQYNVIKAFLDNVAMYHTGTFVKLSNGEIACVVKTMRGFSHRPLVRVYFDRDLKALVKPYERDLTEETGILITRVLDEEDLSQLGVKIALGDRL